MTTSIAWRIGFAVVALASALALAACGSDDGIEGGGGSADVETVKLEGKPSGDVTISNWPFYIDKQTVPDFENESGVKVKYIEDVNDNAEFFAKVQPLLEKGEAGGRSMFVVTDWMAQKMYDLGYLQDWDKAGIPNVEENLLPSLQHPTFDPDRAYSVPWQSGMTGLIVNTDEAPDVKSISDLFDPKYKGKVEMLTEMRDTVPLVMMSEGIDPNEATEDDWLNAIDKLKQAVDDGQIRRFTGNDYTRDMANGDVSAIIGWSGDAVQLQADNPAIEFVMPTEGCILWSDNMVIPVGAPNPTAAEAFADYVYDPVQQAQIADYNYYVTPVNGVKEELQKQGSPAAKSNLVFPSDEFTQNCVTQPTITGEEEQRVTRAFEGVLNS